MFYEIYKFKKIFNLLCKRKKNNKSVNISNNLDGNSYADGKLDEIANGNNISNEDNKMENAQINLFDALSTSNNVMSIGLSSNNKQTGTSNNSFNLGQEYKRSQNSRKMGGKIP